MNDRFGNERDRHGEYGQQWADERSGWGREREERSGWRRERNDRSGWARGEDNRSNWNQGREDDRWHAGSREPRYSSDYDETYGSEWQRGREHSDNDRPGYVHGSQAAGYGQGERGFHGRGAGGMYGGSNSGGYVGGRGGGYSGGTGNDYGRSGASYGGGGYGTGHSGTRGYGGSQAQGWGHEGGFGASSDQGFRGPYMQSPGTDLRSTLRGGFAGRGPKNYVRTDERMREDVCDRLSLDDDVDASDIEVSVKNGEVMLEGSVPTRSMKHRAEDIAEDVAGVKDVHNHLRVIKSMLDEIKDKVTGKEAEQHYANSGTKNSPAGSSVNRTGANGTL